MRCTRSRYSLIRFTDAAPSKATVAFSAVLLFKKEQGVWMPKTVTAIGLNGSPQAMTSPTGVTPLFASPFEAPGECRTAIGVEDMTRSLQGGCLRTGGRRLLETVLSITTLAGLIWVVRVLLPKAAKQDDRFALLCALLTLILALVVWFLIGVPEVF